MNTHMKWSVLPVALLMLGTLAMAQGQVPVEQGSSSPANSTTRTKADSGQLAAVAGANPDSEEVVINGPRAAEDSRLMLIATTGVNQAVNDLSVAFGDRDLEAFRQLWPSIPQKPLAALGKTFVYFKRASRNFKTENMEINGDTATVVGSYSGSFVNGTTIIPSNGKFHATLIKLGTRWVFSSLVCN
jgi:hypothetical protein